MNRKGFNQLLNGFILALIVVVAAIVISLFSSYQGNHENVSYSTSLIQRQPVCQCEHDQENLEKNHGCENHSTSLIQNQPVCQCQQDQENLEGTLGNESDSTNVIHHQPVHQCQQDPEMSLEVSLPGSSADNSDTDDGSENDDNSVNTPCDSVTKEDNGLFRTDQMANSSCQFGEQSDDNARLDVMVKSVKVDYESDGGDSDSNADFVPRNDEVETADFVPVYVQKSAASSGGSTVSATDQDTDDSDGDNSDTNSDFGPPNNVANEENNISRIDEVKRSQQLDNGNSNVAVDDKVDSTVENAEPVPPGVRESVRESVPAVENKVEVMAVNAELVPVEIQENVTVVDDVVDSTVENAKLAPAGIQEHYASVDVDSVIGNIGCAPLGIQESVTVSGGRTVIGNTEVTDCSSHQLNEGCGNSSDVSKPSDGVPESSESQNGALAPRKTNGDDDLKDEDSRGGQPTEKKFPTRRGKEGDDVVYEMDSDSSPSDHL